MFIKLLRKLNSSQNTLAIFALLGGVGFGSFVRKYGRVKKKQKKHKKINNNNNIDEERAKANSERDIKQT